MSNRLSTVVLLSACVLSVGCNKASPENSATAEESTTLRGSSRGVGARARPCRADTIFVDVPLYFDPPWTDLRFLSFVTADLEALAATGGWFCGPGGCPPEPIRAIAEPVLRERAGYAPRQDGHLRFVRIRFEGRTSRAAYSLGDEGACRAVDATRQSVTLHGGAAPDMFYVGRECDVSVMSLQSSPTTDMLAWHTRRLGLPDSVLAATPPVVPGQVDLAVLDTGVDPAVAASLGVAAGGAFGSNGPRREHGTSLAILSRQLAPASNILDVQAVDAGGAGTSATLARALDDVLFDLSPAPRPVVVNLSVGAPPELTRAALLGAGTCVTQEDPFGESFRYVLDVGRRLDVDGVRPVFVSAAAGNRPLPLDPTLFPPPVGSVPTCVPQILTAAPWFIPGHWSRLLSCRSSLPGNHFLTVASSAIDDRHRPSVYGIDGAEAPLVAPGQHVVVAHPAAAPVPGQCVSSPPTTVALPATLSGSSVSSALTAAAAARAQEQLLADGETPLDQDGLARLLYLAGVDVCRSSASGAPVRRLHVGRLDAVLTYCPAVVECARTSAGPEPISASLVQDCAPVLAECGLETMGPGGVLIPTCPVALGAAVPIPTGDAGSTCVAHAGTATLLEASTCGSSCPDASVTDRYSIGSLGPQPPDYGCPHCKYGVRLVGQATVLTIYAELNPKLPTGTSMTSPWLRLRGTDAVTHKPVKAFVDLSTLSPGPWSPGQYRKIEVHLAGLNLVWEEAAVELVIDIVTPSADEAVTDISVLVREDP